MEPERSVKVGGFWQFDIEAAWKTQEADYRFAPPSLALENLSLEESGETNETFQKEGFEWRRKTFRFKLRAVQSGKGRIRPFQLGYWDLQTASESYFEVKGQEISIVPDRTRLYGWLGGGAGFVALSALGAEWLARRLRKKKRRIQGALEAALEERYLSQLDTLTLAISEAGKVFRNYLTEKYSLFSGGTTNCQMLSALETRLDGEELKNLRKIFDKLEHCQFGGSPRSSAEHERLHQEIVNFVQGKKII